MHCREFDRRLNAALDERRPPQSDRWLAAHAASCENCRQHLNAHETLLVGLSEIAMPSLDREFARQVVQQASIDAPRPAIRRWFSVAACLASAAAMLLAVSAVWYARQSRKNDGEAGRPRPSFAVGRQRGAVLAMAQAGGRTAARPTHSTMTSADLLLEAPRLPEHFRGYRDAIDEFAVSFPEGALRLDEVERLAPGIRPLRLSLSMIWDTLCRTFPGARSESPPATREHTGLWWLEPLGLV
jgi:hypothetical protein